MLGVAGTYVLVSELVGNKEATKALSSGTKRLILIGLALSIDNLLIGFALGAYRVNLAVAAGVIGAVSLALSLLGFEIGRHLGERLGKRSELVGGAALILVGVAIGTGLL